MNVSLIRENIENIVNFPYVNLEVQEILMEEAINQQYIITSTSPLILKENYAIAQNSILIQATSFNHLPFNHYTIEEQEGLLELLNYTEYTIDDTTPSFIKLDPRIVLISIKHDLTSFQYTSVELLKNKEIFHYLIKNHYPFTKETLCYLPLYYLMDEEILDFYLKNYFKLDKNSNQFIMMKTLFNHLLHYPVKLKDFESIFRVFIEQSWTTLKIEQENRYKNVLGKLCSELSQNEDIEKILSSSFYVLDMKRKMKKNYALLDENLRKYHQYYHQQEEELLLQSRNIIAEFTKKYQAMIKENYIIEKLEMVGADIKIIKNMSPNPVLAGETITYSFSLYNYGNTEAKNVTLNDTFTPAPGSINVYLDSQEISPTDFSYSSGTLTLPTYNSGISVTIPAANFIQDTVTGLIAIEPGMISITATGQI